MTTLAQQLRDIAKQAEAAEQRGASFYTCNAVGQDIGMEARRSYAHTFGVNFGGENVDDLWESPDCASIRVLMLCFAAAMAETGDL